MQPQENGIQSFNDMNEMLNNLLKVRKKEAVSTGQCHFLLPHNRNQVHAVNK